MNSRINEENNNITFNEIIVHKCLIIIDSIAWDQDAVTHYNYLVCKCRYLFKCFLFYFCI